MRMKVILANIMVLLLAAALATGQTKKSSTSKETKAAASDPQKITDELKLQILLDRAGFSCGEIDGTMGINTRKALTTFQKMKGLAPKQGFKPLFDALGEAETEEIMKYTITTEDVKQPLVESIPEDFMEKAKLPGLHYTSVIEAVAEKHHVKPELLKSLNPQAKFEAGEQILVPNVSNPEKTQDSAKTQQVKNTAQRPDVKVVVSKTNENLIVKDANDSILFHAPVTAGSKEQPLPIGNWKVTEIVRNPAFFYNPDLFWDADPTHSKAKLPPGPNGPVGVLWVGLSAEHYGIHGSPEPSKIGYSASHGCVRMTNWDAMKLAEFIKKGTEVIFE